MVRSARRGDRGVCRTPRADMGACVNTAQLDRFDRFFDGHYQAMVADDRHRAARGPQGVDQLRAARSSSYAAMAVIAVVALVAALRMKPPTQPGRPGYRLRTAFFMEVSTIGNAVRKGHSGRPGGISWENLITKPATYCNLLRLNGQYLSGPPSVRPRQQVAQFLHHQRLCLALDIVARTLGLDQPAILQAVGKARCFLYPDCLPRG